ncbi:MAG: thioredoxin family protein [Planctomycetaceae bacterium]
MRNSRTAGLLFLFAVFAVPGAAPAAAPQWMTDFDAAQREARRLDRPMLVHFYTDWCFPCRQMEKDVLSRPTVLQVLESRLILVKLNAEKHPDLAQRFGVTLFPTDVIVDPTGKRILSSTGYQEADKYVRFARDAERQFVSMHKPVADEGQVSTEAARSIVVAIDGFCPVTLWQDRRWIKGDPQYVVEHRGQTYYLASAQMMAAFEANPRKYVPQLLGCDPVILMDTDLAVPGSVRYGAFYEEELYLFTTQENRVAFKQNPDRYTRTRVVQNIDEIDRPLVR